MKIKTHLFSFLGFCLLNIIQLSYGQVSNIDQETIFGSRIKNPITTELKSDTTNIDFYVKNNSFYPYIVEIEFKDFRNLSPRVFSKKTTVFPGLNKVFTFKLIDRYEEPVLSYTTKYYLAPSNIGDERFSPYLIPTGKNKVVKLLNDNQQESAKTFIDQFVMNSGDTIFCSRKGIVTALPDNLSEVDRIKRNSLEIHHDDGTIAVYLGLDPSKLMVKIGQKVFPSQPIGIIGESNLLTFRVFEIKPDAKIASFEIYYPGPSNQLLSSYNINKTIVIYPIDIIKKEMSKKEITKYSKNNLF